MDSGGGVIAATFCVNVRDKPRVRYELAAIGCFGSNARPLAMRVLSLQLQGALVCQKSRVTTFFVLFPRIILADLTYATGRLV